MEFLHGIKELLVGVFGPIPVAILFILIGFILLCRFLKPVFIYVYEWGIELKNRISNLLSVTSEFKNNHGSSMRDAIDAIHDNVIKIRTDLKIIDGRTITLMSIIGDNKMSVGMYETDANGNCIYVNGKWAELTGMSLEDAQSYGWINCIHYSDREEVQNNWDYSIAHNSKFDMVYRIVNIRTHKEYRVRGYALPIKNSDNSVIRFVGAIIGLDEEHCSVCPHVRS